MAAEPPKDFFTANSIGTFAGASAAVWVLSNVFRVLFKRDSLIFGFVVSLLIAYLGMYAAGTLTGLLGYSLAFLNGCLLFLTAAGIQGFATEAARGRNDDTLNLQRRTKVKFLTPWFK